MEEFDLSSSNRQRPNRPASTHPPLTTAPINTATDSSHYSSRSSSKTRSSSKRQQDSSEDLASLKTSPTRAATPRSPTRPNAALKTASRSNLLADHQSPPPPPPLSLAPLKIRSSFENLGNGHSKSESAPVTAAAASTLSHSHFGHQLLPADYNSSATTESAFAHTRRSSIRPVLKKQKSNLSLKRTTASKLQSLSSTEQVLSSDSEFWQQLLSSTRIIQPTNIQEAFELEMASLQLAEDMAKNNSITGNFNTLLLYLLTQLRFMRHMAYDDLWSSEAYNTLFIVRIYTKYFVDNLSRMQIHEQFEMDRLSQSVSPTRLAPPSLSIPDKRFELSRQVLEDKKLRAEILLEELLHVLIYADTKTQGNYEFYIETLNLMLILFSTQLQKSTMDVTDGNYFLDILLNRLSHFARGTMTRLFKNLIDQQTAPNSGSGGVLYSAYSYLFAAKKPEENGGSLADKSVLFILVLANQCLPKGVNTFRMVLGALQDSGEVSKSQSSLEDVLQETTEVLQVSFRGIYKILCDNLAVEENTLLLYLLVLQNHSFRTYVLSRTDPESLLVPVLKLIYEAVDAKNKYSQLYILLIFVLVVSQDDVYNETIQKVIIPPPIWYVERVIKNVSLGGLTVLVLLRTIQANLSHHKDIYFHTNCLAALANMSSKIINMSAVIAQRLTLLFEAVSKRLLKLQIIKSSGLTDKDEADIIIYGDLVSLLLEIINSVMTYSLHHNPQLVYNLLHRKEMFEPFRLHPRFGDLIQNIDIVITYFHSKVIESGSTAPSSDEVLRIVEQSSKVWQMSKLKGFSELRFQYEEEKEYELFFLPYVWSLVYKHSLIYWDEEKSRLWIEHDADGTLPIIE